MLKQYAIMIQLKDSTTNEVQKIAYTFPKKVKDARLTMTWIEKDQDSNGYAETIIRDKELCKIGPKDE